MSPWILHDLSHVWYEKARLFLWHILRKNEARGDFDLREGRTGMAEEAGVPQVRGYRNTFAK